MKLRKLFRKVIAGETPEQQEERLHSEGLLRASSYSATRSFEVAMYEDEGRHIFIELADGSVLYLRGQYLFDYGIDPADGPKALDTTFPATEFDLVVHGERDYVFKIEPCGLALPPKELFPPFRPEESRAGQVPEDLDLITSHTFDELLASEGRLI